MLRPEGLPWPLLRIGPVARCGSVAPWWEFGSRGFPRAPLPSPLPPPCWLSAWIHANHRFIGLDLWADFRFQFWCLRIGLPT